MIWLPTACSANRRSLFSVLIASLNLFCKSGPWLQASWRWETPGDWLWRMRAIISNCKDQYDSFAARRNCVDPVLLSLCPHQHIVALRLQHRETGDARNYLADMQICYHLTPTIITSHFQWPLLSWQYWGEAIKSRGVSFLGCLNFASSPKSFSDDDRLRGSETQQRESDGILLIQNWLFPFPCENIISDQNSAKARVRQHASTRSSRLSPGWLNKYEFS
jgi:hypothetical protein